MFYIQSKADFQFDRWPEQISLPGTHEDMTSQDSKMLYALRSLAEA